jgi:hypothetical protein
LTGELLRLAGVREAAFKQKLHKQDSHKNAESDVIQLQAHAVVDLVILQGDVVLENAVPARMVSAAAGGAADKRRDEKKKLIQCEFETDHF